MAEASAENQSFVAGRYMVEKAGKFKLRHYLEARLLAFRRETSYHACTKDMKMLFVVLGIVAASATIALTTMAAEAAGKKGNKLRHVVAFKFKDTAAKEDIKKVETAFRDLKRKIKEIQDYEWGTNNSPEKHNKGTTHGFILTFKSEKDRDTYLEHPEHKEFGKLVGPLLADVFVIDFWAQE
jgi:hypothetical protein